MAVNRYQTHLVVFLEDEPYRDIFNGVNLSQNVNANVIEVKKPSGGWGKVFDTFEKNIHLLKKYNNCYILLLMDFDDQSNNASNSKFKIRMNKFQEIVPEAYRNRVFLLGANHKESENLKKEFQLSDFEKIGRKLIENCPSDDLSNWNNNILNCNLEEIKRMQRNGILKWLFKQ